MSPPKVAHVTTIDASLRFLLLNQLLFLERAGYDTVGLSAPGSDLAAIREVGVRHVEVPFERSSRLTPLADLKAFLRLWRIFRRERPTVVHTHTAKPDLYAALAARLAGVPIVVTTLHGFFFHDNMPALWRRFYILLARIGGWCADLVLSQNPEDLDTNLQEGVYARQKVKYLGNGIDIERFDRRRLAEQAVRRTREELDLATGAPVVGFVGRLVRDKGVAELLAAARLVRDRVPGVRFLLVGPLDRAKSDAVTPDLAVEYGVDDICRFVGQRFDMPEIYAQMDLFVLPSYREAFPRAPMEASAMGVPCIVTDVRGCRTVVEDGRNGLLVPLGDVQALADAVVRLLRDREEALAMGRNARRIAENRFDERRVFATVGLEYERLLRARRIAAPAPRPGGNAP